MSEQAAIIIHRTVENVADLKIGALALQRGQWGLATADGLLVCRLLDGSFQYFPHAGSVQEMIEDAQYYRAPVATEINLPSGDPVGAARMLTSNGAVYRKTAQGWDVIGSGVRHRYAGIVSPTNLGFTHNGNGSVTIPSSVARLYTTSDFTGDVAEYTVPQGTFQLVDGGDTIIAVDYNNGAPVYRAVDAWDVSSYNFSDSVPALRLWYAFGTVHSASLDALANGLSEKLALRTGQTDYYRRVGGVGLEPSESTGRVVNITASSVWAGPVLVDVLAASSATDSCGYLWKNSSGVWQRTAATAYPNTLYNPASGLATLGSSKATAIYIYRSIGDVKEMFLVLDTQEYANIDKARTDSRRRTDIPFLLQSHCVNVGRILIVKDAATGEVQSSWDTSFGNSGITMHDNLSGLNAGEYQHLSSTEKTNTLAHLTRTDNPHSVTKTQVGLSNLTNDAQVKRTEMGVASGVATLGTDGKIPTSQLGPAAITDTFVVASQAAQTALTAQVGDVAVRTDLNKSYILKTEPASTFANWQELLTPTDAVLSVFGRTGAVAAASGDYTASQITNTPAGNIAATTVQAALNELDSEKEIKHIDSTAFNQNFDSFTSEGKYIVTDWQGNGATNGPTLPSGTKANTNGYLEVKRVTDSSPGMILQRYTTKDGTGTANGGIWYRTKYSTSAWSEWKVVYDYQYNDAKYADSTEAVMKNNSALQTMTGGLRAAISSTGTSNSLSAFDAKHTSSGVATAGFGVSYDMYLADSAVPAGVQAGAIEAVSEGNLSSLNTRLEFAIAVTGVPTKRASLNSAGTFDAKKLSEDGTTLDNKYQTLLNKGSLDTCTANWNNYTINGVYKVDPSTGSWVTAWTGTGSNGPVEAYPWGVLVVSYGNSAGILQTYTAHRSPGLLEGGIWYRTCVNGTWTTDWKHVLDVDYQDANYVNKVVSTQQGMNASLRTYGVLSSERTNTTHTCWTATLTGDAVPRLVTLADGKMQWGTGSLAADTNLYRRATSTLATDHTFNAFGGVYGLRDAATSIALGVRVGTAGSYEQFDRFCALANGTLRWGDGGNAQDTYLYRTSAGVLRTNGGLHLGVSGETQPKISLNGTNGTLYFGAGGTTAPDVTLFRWVSDGVNTLATDNAINSLSYIRSIRSTTSSAGFAARVGNLATYDPYDRIKIMADGVIHWGPGNGDVDTKLYRNGVGVLRTDGTLQVVTAFSVDGSATLGNSTGDVHTMNGVLTGFASDAAGPTTLGRSTSLTNASRWGVAAKHKTSGDMVDGFGVSYGFRFEDSAGVNNDVARITAVRKGSDTNADMEVVCGANKTLQLSNTLGDSYFQTTTTGTQYTPFLFKHITSASPAAGMGASVNFWGKDATNDAQLGQLIFTRTGTGTASKFAVTLNDTMAMVEVTSTGVSLTNTLTVGDDITTTAGDIAATVGIVSAGTDTQNSRNHELRGWTSVRCKTALASSVAKPLSIIHETTADMTSGHNVSIAFSGKDPGGTFSFGDVGFARGSADNSGATFVVTDNNRTNTLISASATSCVLRGKVTCPASTTSFASLNIPHGTAPTTPANGDVWTTTSGMYVRINGVTKTVTLT